MLTLSRSRSCPNPSGPSSLFPTIRSNWLGTSGTQTPGTGSNATDPTSSCPPCSASSTTCSEHVACQRREASRAIQHTSARGWPTPSPGVSAPVGAPSSQTLTRLGLPEPPRFLDFALPAD